MHFEGKQNVGPIIIMIIALLSLSACASKTPFAPVEQVPSEAPPQTLEFILGQGDKIDIQVYRHDDLKRTALIDVSGKISYPLLGDVQATGISVFALRDKIRAGLSKFVVDPDVTVSVSSTQTQKIIVLGEVKTPGVFQAESATTALEAISRAGGYTLDGKLETVLLIRGGLQKPQLFSLNLEKTLKDGDLTQNVMLQRGDIIYVPRTFIADVDRFFGHMTAILQPIVLLESGIFLYQQIDHFGEASAVTVVNPGK